MRFFVGLDAGEGHGQDTIFHRGFDGFLRDVGWESKGPDEGTSPSLAHDVPTVLPKEGRDLARDRQSVVVHVDCDLVSRDTGKFEGDSYPVRGRIFEYVHSGLEDTTDAGSLGDMIVRAGVVVDRVIVVVRREHVIVVSCDGHVG